MSKEPSITIKHVNGNTVTGTVSQVLSSHLVDGWSVEAVTDTVRRCEAVRDGRRCDSFAVIDTDRCHWHTDPRR